MRSRRTIENDLEVAAQLYGVETSYVGADGAVHRAEPDVMLATLRALGVEIEQMSDARATVRARRLELARRLIEPVITCREHAPASFVVTLPPHVDPDALGFTIEFEDGTTRHDRLRSCAPSVDALLDVDGEQFRQLRVDLDRGGLTIPLGYHHLRLDSGAPSPSNSLLVCAPRCPQPSRGWGVFMPLHALRTDHDWGIGSYLDMATLGEWAKEQGSSMMGALPLYPTFSDPPVDPSPYRPVSRLAYNELYIDPEALPELDLSDVARERLRSAEFRLELKVARARTTVDYEEVAHLRRQILEPLAEALRGAESRRRDEFELFVREHPELLAYGHFRAALERRALPVVSDLGETRGGADALDPLVHYYVYCQWVAAQQLQTAASALPLYADLPVGVHPEGFDPYWSPGSFLTGVSGGAPPDLFFTEGQNWAFAPQHPEHTREDHYHYLRAVLRRAVRHASYLRVDHVMGLQRLYVIPEGGDPTQGAYLSYRADELHALVALEAHRGGTSVVGEDLGTVPPEVRERMRRDGMLRSWVFEFSSTASDPLPDVPRDVLATLATHDMPRFSAFLWGHDIDEAEAIHRRTSAEAERARKERAHYREALFGELQVAALSDVERTEQARSGCLEHLGASEALLVLVDLEELWGEDEPQNRPGTTEGNWQRRGTLTLEEIRAAPQVSAPLAAIDRQRRGTA